MIWARIKTKTTNPEARMRLFIATLSTETNTFSTMPTGLSGFYEYCFRAGTATDEPPNLMTEALHVWRARAEALGWDVVESLTAIAEPAGRTVASVYAGLKTHILNDLREAGPVDIVLLQLHGAMVAEGEDDCEGDIAAEMRTIFPNATIGMALDLHAHLTPRMMTACDLIISFKEYPHDDATLRAEELFDLALRTHMGEIRPTMAAVDCRMIHLYLTKSEPMRSFVDRLSAMETGDTLSISLIHGFPWGDVEHVGAQMLVVTHDDEALARSTAQTLAREFFDLRHAVTGQYTDINTGLDTSLAAKEHPIVLAEMGDNSGGGAPGDATPMLRALLDRGCENVATGIYWDPMVVRQCQDAGEGARITLRLGGKTSPMSGDPVDLTVTVMKITTGLGQHLGTGLEPLGTLVWARYGDDFDILINDLRTQVYHPEAFEQIGIRLSEKHIVTVKSLFHFYGPFSEVASEIIQVASPGGTCPKFDDIALTKRKIPFWPREDDPFAS
ncbi:MAG: M81 family metallopeptidase [Pseudomonadota bacterium]